MRIRYNAPFTLSFSLIATVVMIFNGMTNGVLVANLFSIGPEFRIFNPIDLLRLTTHVMGHLNWEHLLSNITVILLIGPILEEKHGSRSLLSISMVTAIIIGILNLILTNNTLLGASGIVFMMIVMVSITNIRSGEIPLTFILVMILFLAREFVGAFRQDNVSQLAHIIGGLCGGLFGFLIVKRRNRDGT